MKVKYKGIVLMLAVAQLLSSCGILPKEEEFQTAPVVQEFQGANYGKTKVQRGDLVQSENITATYHGTEKSELAHPDTLKVKNVCVKKGSKVKEGDVLIRYYLEGAELKYEEADYKIKTAAMDIRHQKELLKLEIEKQNKVGDDKKAIQSIKEEYQANIKQIESDLRIYELEKKEAKKDMEEYDLKANLSGTVTFLESGMEGKVAGEDRKTVITIEGEKKNRFEAKTTYTDKFKEGEIVNISILQNTYKVRVRKSDKSGKSIYFVPVNENTQFREGESGDVTCILNQKKNVLYLPSGVIYKMGDKDIVYVEDQNGMKKVVEIKKGVEISHLTEIISGINEGEEVVIN